MNTTQTSSSYSDLIEFLVEKATPEAILSYRASETAIERMEVLTEKNKANQISPEEREELENMLTTEDLLIALKARALVSIRQPV